MGSGSNFQLLSEARQRSVELWMRVDVHGACSLPVRQTSLQTDENYVGIIFALQIQIWPSQNYFSICNGERGGLGRGNVINMSQTCCQRVWGEVSLQTCAQEQALEQPKHAKNTEERRLESDGSFFMDVGVSALVWATIKDNRTT